GTWLVLSIFGVKFPIKILVAEEPERHEVGPYVLKTNMARQVLIEPKYQVKWVHIPLETTTVTTNKKCTPFVEPLLQSWEKWLWSIIPSKRLNRNKRDIVAKVLGGVSAGIGIASVIDNARLAKNIAKLTSGTEGLIHPLEESLLGLDKVQVNLANLLPEWAQIQEEDHLKMLKGMQILANETALAFACIQIQNISRNIICDALAGKLPIEIAALISSLSTPFERENQDLWEVLHSEYDPRHNTLHVVVLTVLSAQKDLVYPIAMLGMFINGSVLPPFANRVWAHQNPEGTFNVVNMQACMEQKYLGYVCTTSLWDQGHLCLNEVEGECNYELHLTPLGNNHSAVVQIDSHCICIRSLCSAFRVNRFYKVTMPRFTILCLCKVFEIQGCDVAVKLINAEYEDITVRYAVIDTITPISLGPNIDSIKAMMVHPVLKNIISDIKNISERVHVVVQHAADNIVTIGKRIHVEPTWWSTLFG
uniref:Uncharacterized protein n=1 Tax=Pelodiscus sinensis TaxID=13735 RepID=K7GDG2_PELSI